MSGFFGITPVKTPFGEIDRLDYEMITLKRSVSRLGHDLAESVQEMKGSILDLKESVQDLQKSIHGMSERIQDNQRDLDELNKERFEFYKCQLVNVLRNHMLNDFYRYRLFFISFAELRNYVKNNDTNNGAREKYNAYVQELGEEVFHKDYDHAKATTSKPSIPKKRFERLRNRYAPGPSKLVDSAYKYCPHVFVDDE